LRQHPVNWQARIRSGGLLGEAFPLVGGDGGAGDIQEAADVIYPAGAVAFQQLEFAGGVPAIDEQPPPLEADFGF